MVRLWCTLLALGFIAGCATTPQMTPMELQELQTREFEGSKEIVFNSGVSVFQDLGYVISQADVDTGIVTAEGMTQTNIGMAFFGVNQNEQAVVSAFLEEFGQETRVRLNFVARTRTGLAGRDDRAVLDSEVYQNAFERIEQAIFVRLPVAS